MIRFLVVLLGLLSTPAMAHKVIFDAYASGPNIEGELGFSNGEMAADHNILIQTPDGRPLGQITTDADGFFLFTPDTAVTHVFTADLGAGHVAETTLSLAELPKGLGADTPPTAAASLMNPEKGLQNAQTLSPAQTELVAEMLRDELRPLRRELIAYREKNDLQGILGGIGYIAGIFGLGFYLAARRKMTQKEDS